MCAKPFLALTRGLSRSGWQIFKKNAGQKGRQATTQENAREAFGGLFRRDEEPEPRLGTDPSLLRGLFHPDASTVADPCCAMVSGVLNLDELRCS